MWKLYRADLLGKELETNLQQIIIDARTKQHKILSVEHLLLAMLDNASAVEMLQSREVSVDELRTLLAEYIQKYTCRSRQQRSQCKAHACLSSYSPERDSTSQVNRQKRGHRQTYTWLYVE